MKIIFADKTELSILSYQETTNYIEIKVLDEDYTVLLNEYFTNEERCKEMTIDNNYYANYTKRIYSLDEEFTDPYTKQKRKRAVFRMVQVGAQDAINLMNEKIVSLQEVNTELKSSVETIKTDNEVLKETNTQIQKSIKAVEEQINPVIDVESMTLDELKEYKIGMSKVNLAEHLENNPLESTCHGEKPALYSITNEKQNLMMSNYLTYQIKKSTNPDVKTPLMWNATGEECTEWTEEEFLQLIIEVEAKVKPLVAAQQAYEKQVVACVSKEDIEAIVLNYATV